MQQLVLVRHALAQPPGLTGDLQRALRPEGKAQAQAAGERLKELRPEGFRTICASPARRCLETAEALAATLGAVDVTHCSELLESADGEDLRDLAERAEDGTILVGHQPPLVLLAAALVGTGTGGHELRPGSFLVLSREGPGRRHSLVTTWHAPAVG